uniref:Gypsy retrotransposon integrase-like protein 1 n=1 Tax=Nothobranchius furzeri TaxID=105023 RepID=A0A8C6NPQ6_NOTFU
MRLLWGSGSSPCNMPHTPGKRSLRVGVGAASLGVSTHAAPHHTTLSVSFQLSQGPVPLVALLDTGAAESFIDQGLVNRLKIPLTLLDHPVPVTSVDGRPLMPYPITHRTQNLRMTIGEHVETLHFLVIHAPTTPLILGHSWFRLHDPHISWSTSKVMAWGVNCRLHHPSPGSQPRETPPKDVDLTQLPGSQPRETPPKDVDLTLLPPQYHDLARVFAKEPTTKLPPHRPYDLEIRLQPGTTPPRGRLFSLSPAETQAMDAYINEALQKGFIRHSTSPGAAGFFFVKKKEGDLRPCIDYRGLNKITIRDRHPLPLMSTALDATAQATLFTKLDLRSAYNLIRIKEGEEWKTAFITPTGHYEYLVMPFGLCNSPAVFQRFITDVLRDMLGRWVFVYLDDILIYSRTAEEHTQHVRAVLSRLLEHDLFCKLEKCAFHQESTSFLGFIISSQGLRMDPQKVQAVAQWPLPKTLKQLQSFLGFCNFYRRFIRNFSALASPLTSLTKTTNQPRPFRLSPEAVAAFHELVRRFVSEPILLHPDLTRPFVVEVDASETGAGAVLSQRGQDSKLHPCAFFSRKFSPTQQNYGVGDRELLAIKWALEEWRQWLLGTPTPFLIWTDHQNLIHIQTARQLNPRQARWALFFEPYNFHIAYRPGSKNLKADALSRQHTQDPRPPEPRSILPTERFLAALQWPLEASIRAALPADPAPPETPPNRLYVPAVCRQEALRWGHSSRLAGHQGQARTFQFLRRALWWPSMRKDVREYTAACDTCARSKSTTQPGAGELQPLPVPKRPWSHIGVDFVTGLPVADHLDTILTITDRFSKAVHLVAMAGLPTAKKTAELLLDHVVRLHGFPQDVVSDRGPQFISRFWKAFCRLVGASASLSSGYHPQTNGQTERANQQLGRYLRCFASSQPSTWPRYLLWAELSHNLQTSSATGLSPFETCYGYQPPLFDHQVPEVEVPAAQDMVRRCHLAWIRARAAITRANTEYSRQHRRRHRPGPVFQPGDRVWLSTANLRFPAGSRKLSPRFLGPFPVRDVLGPVAYRLRLPSTLKVHPVFHVSQLKPVVSSPLHPPPARVPTPRDVDGDPVYTVRKILDARRRGRGWQYLVDWQGYGPEERSWEPARSFLDPSLLADFWSRRPGPSGAVPRGGVPVMNSSS